MKNNEFNPLSKPSAIHMRVAAVGNIAEATSVSVVLEALHFIARKPGTLLSRLKREESNKKGFRIFLTIMACIFIVGVTYAAFIGGGYIGQYNGPIALVFGVLDLSIVFLLLLNAVKGRLRWIAVIFEIASLAYLGYAMSGYFGGGNIQTAAEKKVAAAYIVAKQHYEKTKATANLFATAIANAQNVADAEKARDGKGVVFEKASFISLMKPTIVQSLPELPKVPQFSSLTEGNKWLQGQRQKLIDDMTSFDAANIAMRNQASGTAKALENAVLTHRLSDMQTSNLMVLLNSMQEVASAEKASSTIADDVLAPSDLKADGFQNFIGYIIDFVIIFFIIMLALQKSETDEQMLANIKKEEVESIIREVLSEQNVDYIPETITEISLARQYDALKIVINSETLLAYLKRQMSFNEYLIFLQEHPQIARQLKETAWTIAEIKNEIQKNPGFANIAEKVLTLSSADWNSIVRSVSEPEKLLLDLGDEERKIFVQILKKLQAKSDMNQQELKSFIDTFLLSNKMEDISFIKKLEICVSMLSAAKLQHITSDFIEVITEDGIRFISANVDDEKRFGQIVTGWNQSHTTSLSKILSNGIVQEPQFNRFIKAVFNQGGIEGFKTMAQEYVARVQEASNTAIGNKKVGLNVDFEALQKSLSGKSAETRFMKLVKAAFFVQSVEAVV